MMKKSIFLIIQTVIFIALIAFTLFYYQAVPDLMASHWNVQGEVDGYMPKLAVLIMSPAFILLMTILSVGIVKMDPLYKNIQKFVGYFYGLMIIMSIFFTVIHLYVILWALGNQLNIIYFISPLFGLLFFYIALLLEKSERNWSIGIKTPWTLSSDVIWNKTHKLGAKLYIVSGILCLTGFFFPDLAFYFVLAPIIIFSIFLFFYSYFLSKRTTEG